MDIQDAEILLVQHYFNSGRLRMCELLLAALLIRTERLDSKKSTDLLSLLKEGLQERDPASMLHEKIVELLTFAGEEHKFSEDLALLLESRFREGQHQCLRNIEELLD